MGGIGPMEIILILAVVVLLFGAKKIPDLAKGIGQGLREFKKASRDAQEDVKEVKGDSAKESDKPAVEKKG